MHNSDPIPRPSKWPFFLGDALLLGLAYAVWASSATPMGKWQILLYFGCVAIGAGLSVWPFVLEYEAVSRLAEVEGMSTVMAQIKNLEVISAHIRAATAQWQSVQETSDKTRAASKDIADRMTAEAQAFTQFMGQANESEKAALRLEVDKLRRAEGDWLQVLVRMLDHVYALHRAALRSGQPELVEQLGQFQHACRDAARRIGLTPFTPAPDEPFDEQRHRVADEKKPGPGALVEDTMAAGYNFQGQMIRPALVRVRDANVPGGVVEPAPQPQGRLALDATTPD